MEFEWDNAKSDDCRRRRGFTFAFASRIFAGPILEEEDVRFRYDEQRIKAIGAVGGRVLAVICTDRDDVCRIISALDAEAWEKKLWRRFVGL